MDFQLYTVSLEDRLPRGLPADVDKDELLYDGFQHSVSTVAVEKERMEGCVAVVFGRTSDGTSVAVRVEGVRPRLFFALEDGESVGAVRVELEKEVKLDTRLHVEERRFCHFYGYEPDEAQPSGRRVHRYLEAFYPSLSSWRAACRLRKLQDLHEMHARVAELRAQAEGLAKEVTATRVEASRAGSTEAVRRHHLDVQRRAQDADKAHVAAVERYTNARAGWEEWTADHEEKEEDGREEREEREEDETTKHKQQKKKQPLHRPCRRAQEWFVEPLTRFLQEARLTPSRWARLTTLRPAEVRLTTCDVEVEARMGDFEPLPDRDDNAPYRTLYYDIETLGLDPTTAQVIQVSLVFVTAGSGQAKVDRHLVAVGSVASIPDVTVHSCVDERALLLAMRRLVLRKDPDFVVAYNGVNFDNNFLAVRAKAVDAEEFWYLSRFALRPTRLRELPLSSSGMGDNLLRYVDMPGRCNFDWYVKLKRDLTSEPSYKLNHFAKKFCGDEKEDMHYKEIPVLQRGSAEDRARLGSYCVHDSVLLHRLDEARTMVVEILQFASVFGIVAEWVYFRGQQVRFVAQLLAKARVVEAVPLLLQRPAKGFNGAEASGFKGATVNEPKAGFYKVPVATLDWKSLYPSIMISHNLCHSTWVNDPKLFGAPGIVEHTFDDGAVTRFASPQRHKGVLPLILEELLAERSKAKKLVKLHVKGSKDTALSSEERTRHEALSKVYDGRQLALKVSCNSMYGACGTSLESGAKYPLLDISATVTHEGREAMVVKKTILPQRFPGIDVIYGDSVAPWTPLLLRVRGRVRVCTAQTLVPDEALWFPTRDGKEVAPLHEVESWTESGWTRVRTVFRHRVPRARLRRVCTGTSLVDVTEDHSLLRADGTCCTPAEVTATTMERERDDDSPPRLLQAWPPVFSPSECELTLREAYALGMVVREEEEEAQLARYRPRVLVLSERREQCLDVKGQLRVPESVLNATVECKHRFLEAVLGGDVRAWTHDVFVRVRSQALALGLFALLRDVGYLVRVAEEECQEGTTTTARYVLRRWRSSSDPQRVRSVRPLAGMEHGACGGETTVYDLTTSNHHFHAGAGELIVHNTDSVMVTFAGVTDVQACGVLAAEAADFVTDHFKRVLRLSEMELEFEKIYFPYLLEGKKRYTGLKYEPDAQGTTMVCKGIDAKGVETERKDTLPFLKDMFYDVRDALLYRIDEQEALRCFQSHMDRLVRDEVPMDKLTLRKTLSSKVQSKTDTIVQAKVNALRRAREPGSEAAVNEQVEYVIVNGHRKDKTTQMAEDPVYAKEQGLKLNRLWYFEHCVEEAMRKVFKVFDTVDFKRVCDRYRQALNMERLGVQSGLLRGMMTNKKKASAEESGGGGGSSSSAKRSKGE